MKAKLHCFFLMAGISMMLVACSKKEAPQSFSAFSEHKFNDILTSLDYGHGDTLLIGTENGKIIFFNTNDATSKQVKVGDDRVYFVRQDTLPGNKTPVTIVGMRNEGLKIFMGDQLSEAKSLTLETKGCHYSVYKVEHYGNWLFCATSNGLAKLNLLQPDSLQALHPGTVQPDYKISAIQRMGDTLYASFDTLLHVFSLDADTLLRTDTFHDRVRNLYINKFGSSDRLIVIREDSLTCKGMPSYRNSLGVHSCIKNTSSEHIFLLMTNDRILIGNNLNPDSLTICQLTLANEQYTRNANIIAKQGFTYFISGSSLCQIPNHLPREKHITAIAGNDDALLAISDQNEIYSSKDNFRRINVVKHNAIQNEISQAIPFQDKLCVLSGGNVFFQVNGRTAISLKSLHPGKFDQTEITRMYHDSARRHLGIAFRNGFAYGRVTSGLLDTNGLIYDTTLLSVQCFAQPDKNTLYVGTLNDGCVVRNLVKNENTDTLFPYRSNITDLVICKDKMFVLTPMALYADRCDGKVHFDSIDHIHNLYIHRIHAFSYQNKHYLLGVSKTGGLYVFHQDSLAFPIDTLFPDVLFYPDAVHIQDNVITAGSSLGLVEILLENHKATLKNIELRDPFFVRCENFVRKHLQMIVNIGVPAAIVLMLLVLFLSIWSFYKTKKNKKLSDLNETLEKQKSGYETKLKELKGSINELGNTVKTLGEKNKKLNDLNETLKKQKSGYETKLEELKGTIETLDKEKRNYVDDISKFHSAHEALRYKLLGDKLLQEERFIGEKPMSEYLKKYKEHEIFIDHVRRRVDEINRVEVGRNDFYQEMQRQTNSIHQDHKLLEFSISMEALALRSWCIEHYQELMTRSDWDYVRLFRKQISSISDIIKDVVKFSARRDEETRSIYLKLWSSALLLKEPTLKESIPIDEENTMRKEKEPDLIVKLLKPRYLRLLLFDDLKLSDVNFARKKSNLFADLKEMKSYKGRPNETPPVFECEYPFLIEALEAWGDLKKDD